MPCCSRAGSAPTCLHGVFSWCWCLSSVELCLGACGIASPSRALCDVSRLCRDSSRHLPAHQSGALLHTLSPGFPIPSLSCSRIFRNLSPVLVSPCLSSLCFSLSCTVSAATVAVVQLPASSGILQGSVCWWCLLQWEISQSVGLPISFAMSFQ